MFIHICTYQGFFQRLLQRGKDATAMDKMLGSFLGGAFSGIPGSMWELTMIQQQRFGGSIVSTPARIIQVIYLDTNTNKK